MPRKQKLTAGQLVFLINSLEERTAKLSDSALPQQTDSFRERLKKGETLDDLLPESFALVREAAKRKLRQRHYDVQLLGGLALHQGKVAEIKTGEGKTLVVTLPAYLNALQGWGTHIVTVNEYLARRDAEWMGPVFAALGLSVGSIVPDHSYLYQGGNITSPFPVAVSRALKECTRKEAYRADITYGVVSEFGFDYLRDNTVTDVAKIVQRTEEEGGYHFAVIDEVDSILIDEARTPLVIAQETSENTTQFERFAQAIRPLEKDKDYTVDEELKTAYLTEAGQAKLEHLLGIKNLYTPENETLAFHADAALKAAAVMKRDKEYVVKDGEVIIVDEFTGRFMAGRRFTEGLHQAIEAKEGVAVKAEQKTLASISVQSYFKKYRRLAGMSGTALSAKQEFEEVYGMTVEEIPTNKPVARLDRPDQIFLTKVGKDEMLIREVEERHLNNQPVLLGTRSIEENEHLSLVLDRAKIEHQVLNAKNHLEEAKIIAQTGRTRKVTVATNLAGRGVDILLGGNPPDPTDRTIVSATGGLTVIGTERHESKRIDDQLRGRSGRQGDPGVSIFFLSLEDELVRLNAPEEIEAMREQYEKWPPHRLLTDKKIAAIFSKAQERVEARNAEIRRQLLRYDTFVGGAREAVYKTRRSFLTATNLQKTIARDIATWLSGISVLIKRYTVSAGQSLVDFGRAVRVMRPLFVGVSDDIWLDRFHKVKTVKEFRDTAFELIAEAERRLLEKGGPDELARRQRKAYLAAIDTLWMEHLTALETIRAGIDFVSLAGKEPLDEFKREADEKFRALLARIPEQAVEHYLKSLS